MELPEDSKPPEEIWYSDERIADHFQQVRERMSSGGDRSGWESVPDGDDLPVRNQFARDLVK
jgi:hypothetical protein